MEGESIKEITVYTDGSCKMNGRANPKGGIGVYFGDLNKQNKSLSYIQARNLFYDKYTAVETLGPATNNKAELLAILFALIECEQELQRGIKVIVKSDSSYSINCCCLWYLRWELNNWKTSTGKDVLNSFLIKIIVENFIKKYPKLISFKHINSHLKTPNQNDPKYKDWYGNDVADRLAVLGSEKD